MITLEKIENQVNLALVKLNEVETQLKQFEEGWKYGKIWELENKLNDGKERNEEQKKRWERWIVKLEKEKERLEKKETDWMNQVIYLQNKLVNFENFLGECEISFRKVIGGKLEYALKQRTIFAVIHILKLLIVKFSLPIINSIDRSMGMRTLTVIGKW
ncbi:16389_t:CDS:2 [Funneliformis caledonium]|uniref:16389_t:CDS:1 n=1 Tax=Funneliformis caledonium TaxID=1117310 RepID=A0A9N9GMG6_9GLOM|nr:16389_t:CDS:2 [Funneliformis caledonium]